MNVIHIFINKDVDLCVFGPELSRVLFLLLCICLSPYVNLIPHRIIYLTYPSIYLSIHLALHQGKILVRLKVFCLKFCVKD